MCCPTKIICYFIYTFMSLKIVSNSPKTFMFMKKFPKSPNLHS